MRLLLFDASIGLFLLTAIAIAAHMRRRRSTELRICGWILVALPLPAAVVAHLALHLPTSVDQSLFVTGAVAFAFGAFILLGRDEEDWREEREEDSPPWWPAFERELRGYELELMRRRQVVRS